MALTYIFDFGFRTLIWNDKVDTWKELMPATSEEDSKVNTWEVFKKNPGLLYASSIVAFKYLGVNLSATDEYEQFWKDASFDNLKALLAVKPGVLGGAFMTLIFIFDLGLRSLIFNSKFAAKDFMFAKDASVERDIGLGEFGRISDKWPGFIYCIILLSVKYGLVNFSARDEYLKAFLAIGGLHEVGELFKKHPGVAAVTIFVMLKFFEEVGAKVFFDPRLLDEYRKFWRHPTLENAKGLFNSGVVGAALFAIGKGIDSLPGVRGGLAGALEKLG